MFPLMAMANTRVVQIQKGPENTDSKKCKYKLHLWTQLYAFYSLLIHTDLQQIKMSRVVTVKVRISSQVDSNKVFPGPGNH